MSSAKNARDGALGVFMYALVQLADAYRDIPDRAEDAMVVIGLFAVPFAWRIARARFPWLDPTEKPA